MIRERKKERKQETKKERKTERKKERKRVRANEREFAGDYVRSNARTGRRECGKNEVCSVAAMYGLPNITNYVCAP